MLGRAHALALTKIKKAMHSNAAREFHGAGPHLMNRNGALGVAA
jgi:hypothetical protein